VKNVRRTRYLLLNKPRGYVTTRADPEGRPTVLHLLKGVREYVYPAGRLDYDSEGLLILTNDGDLAARITHPRHEIEKVYEVRVLGEPDDRDLDRLRKGVMVEGRKTAPAGVSRASPGLLRITIREGRTRQVRRMMDAIGHPARELRRVRIGPVSDPRLKPGEFRDLTPKEVDGLKRSSRSD
jgi:pseudouridine synthase